MKTIEYLTLASMLSAHLCGEAVAQTTVYGVADVATVYSSNQNGRSALYLRSGNQASSRLGVKGNENFGGATKAIYVLEAGLNLDDGTASSRGSLFNRQSYVGLSDTRAGTITIGRQYAPYYLFVGPVGQVGAVTGATGAHPGDIDGLDATVRFNNSLSYATPTWGGAQFGVMVASGEQAGHAGHAGSLSAALKYNLPHWSFALGYEMLKNAPNPGNWDTASSSSLPKSPVNAGYLSAAAVQYWAAAARDQIGSIGLGAIVTNVQYRPDGSSQFASAAIYNTAGTYLSWQTASPWLLGAAACYTRENATNGNSHPASYRQLSLEQSYALSTATVLYVLEAVQKAQGQTLGLGANGYVPVQAVGVVGDSQTSSPSSGPRQNVLMAGLRHSF